jgi:carbon storage regulator
MLVLTRRHGESVRIGSNIRVTIVASTGGQVRIAIDAPEEIGIYREEIFERVAAANLEAASNAKTMVSGSESGNGLQVSELGGNENG